MGLPWDMVYAPTSPSSGQGLSAPASGSLPQILSLYILSLPDSTFSSSIVS